MADDPVSTYDFLFGPFGPGSGKVRDLAPKFTKGEPGMLIEHRGKLYKLGKDLEWIPEVDTGAGDVQRTRLDTSGKWEVENADGTKMDGRLE